MTKNPELFGERPAQVYHDESSEKERLLPTYYGDGRKFSKKVTKKTIRYLYRNRKKIVRRTVQFALFLLIVFVVYSLYKLYFSKRGPYCTTELCQRTEQELLGSIDFEMHPCKNFYKFACGNWAKHHNVPSGSIDTSVVQEAEVLMINKIINFLDKVDSTQEPTVVHEVRKFYRSCMKTGISDGQTELGEIVNILKEVQLPLAPRFLKPPRDFSWPKTVALSKKLYDKNFFFEFDITMDPKNHSFNRIIITKPRTSTTFSSVFNLDPNTVQAFSKPKYLNPELLRDSDIAHLTRNPYYKFIKTAYKFAYSAANILWSKNIEKKFNVNFVHHLLFSSSLEHVAGKYPNNQRHLPKLYTITDLQKFTDGIFKRHKSPLSINWKKYLIWMFQGTNVTLDFHHKDTTIMVANVDYLHEIFHLISTTSNYAILSHLWWETVYGAIMYTNSILNNYGNQFLFRLTGVQNKPRNVICAEITNNLYGFAVSSLILDDPSLKQNIAKITDMVDNIQFEFSKIINNLDWLDDKTRKRALRKLSKVTKRIGYPEWMDTKENFNKYYENATCTEDNFLENVSKLKRLQIKWKLMYYRLSNSDPADGWYSKYVLQTNAFYVMEKNSMIIPAGIFPFPFYQLGLEALNYGAIGMIIGHELTHGFDNTGKEFDESGCIRPWWSEKTQWEFQGRAQCFINNYEQLNQGVVRLQNTVNGNVTLDENIADNGGLQLAYYAYKNYVHRYGQEQRLPRLKHFTPEQLFFLSFAHTWCEHRSEQSIRMNNAEPHSPYAIRVLGTLKNFQEFADVWKCKKGMPMNPKTPKCQLW